MHLLLSESAYLESYLVGITDGQEIHSNVSFTLGEFYVQSRTELVMNRRQLLSVSAPLFVLGAGCLGQPDDSTDGGSGQSGSGAGVNDAKLKLEKYKDHEKAIDDGYQNIDTCIGGLGTPFVKENVPQVSYDMPNVLFYERTDTEQYELRGAEWFVPTSDVEDPPALFAGDDRRTFRGPMEGHYSDQPRHYGLHVWLFTENPNGQFANSNPNLTCSD
ncbi:hypothetical protein EGH24_15120 [Halonotius terrestris]|jgi:hypothetical protein|uniref:Uncharacterized protein n=2 Tax=Halobacteriales TaxID=2235 RepID=A0A8J8P730_9EURY|nr:hypothetical protein [Halonotius terrestris]TQQ78361.1 hypothetical protein EGH24_15120 [Halonotius terrestris]